MSERTAEERLLLLEQFVITHKETSDTFRKDMKGLIVLLDGKIDKLIKSDSEFKLDLQKDKVKCQSYLLDECKKYTSLAITWVLAIPAGITTILGVVWVIKKLNSI